MANLKSELDEYLSRNSDSKPLLNGLSVNVSIPKVGSWFKRSEQQDDSEGWFDRAQKDYCPALSRVQRIIGFSICVCLGLLCFFIAAMYIPVLLLKARKFALLYTTGSLFLLFSFSFLWGPMNHLRHLFSRERLCFTGCYIEENPAEQYYRELNCKPIYEAGEPEPTRYDCSHLNGIKENQCYHNGKFYSEGNELPNSEVSPCVTNCRCRNSYSSDRAEFSCVNIECPTLFGVRPKEGCYFQYELGKCCYTKERCDSEGEVATCEWDGTIYKEGQTFSPSGSCMNCVCMKGFNGTLGEPWCRKFSCDLNLHYGSRLREGCVPTYYKVNDCCPIPVFRCPSDIDKIEGEPVATAKSGDNQCIFGNLKVAKGQKLNVDPDNKCVRCSCEVPPHLTCTMDRQCYESDFPSEEEI